MQVILLKDVKKLGRAHEVVTVADGFALNQLIPSKAAVAATPAARKEAEARMAKQGARKELDAALLKQNIASLADARVVITAKANEKEHLYNAIGAEEISAATKAQTHIDIPAEAIKLEKPFKELGTFTVPVAHGETFGEFKIVIEAE